ncbi:hypothetical protein H1R20_g12705, partial [Candolleomyces eurysporus]
MFDSSALILRSCPFPESVAGHPSLLMPCFIYNQRGCKAPIFNGRVNGGIRMFTGGSVRYPVSVLTAAMSHRERGQTQEDTETMRPSGIYHQDGAEQSIYNGDINEVVLMHKDTHVTFEDSYSEENSSSQNSERRGSNGHARHGHSVDNRNLGHPTAHSRECIPKIVLASWLSGI